MIYKTIPLVVVFFILKAGANDCIPRKFKYDSIVCVCNSTYCDSTPEIEEPEKGSYHVYVSSKDGLRMSFSIGKFQNDSSNVIIDAKSHKADLNSVKICRDKKYQTIDGFGGSFTDSAGINIKSLSTETQEMLMESYFGQSGSRYSFGRIPIGGTDFSVRKYTLDDTEKEDENLEHFKLAEEDLVLKIPYIKRAMEMSPNIKLTAAPWSSPAWMKTNNKLNGPGILKPKFYQTYANYYLKFLQAYKSHGIDISSISTGNEPNNAFIPGMSIFSLGWLPYSLGNWTANYLGPTLANSEYNKTGILVLDDQRFFLGHYIDMFASNKKALNYISGIAVHWYYDEYFPPTFLDVIHNKYPNKYLLMTEASNGFKINDNPKVQLGSWKRAERYILDIIENLSHWVVGWIDWNLALDDKGGPNVIKNYVDSAIIVNSTSDEFYKQPMYYAIYHFSRYIEPGSVRIESTNIKDIKVIAFETPSKTIVVVLYNTSSEDKNVTIIDSKSGTIKIEIRSYSIYTILYK